MSKEYIPVATSDTIYYEPLTEQEMEETFEVMKIGDMIFNKWTFQVNGGMWYTMGLMDKSNPDTKMLFPNILMSERLKPLRRWGMARMAYLKEYNQFLATQLGTVGLHKHCLEIEEQAEQRKKSMMEAIRKNSANKVTECDKAQDPIVWVGRMNNFQAKIHEVIYSDLIFS